MDKDAELIKTLKLERYPSYIVEKDPQEFVIVNEIEIYRGNGCLHYYNRGKEVGYHLKNVNH